MCACPCAESTTVGDTQSSTQDGFYTSKKHNKKKEYIICNGVCVPGRGGVGYTTCIHTHTHRAITCNRNRAQGHSVHEVHYIYEIEALMAHRTRGGASANYR